MSGNKRNIVKTVIAIAVLVIILLNLINYAFNHHVINKYLQSYFEQKEYNSVEIQPHNSIISEHIDEVGKGNSYLVLYNRSRSASLWILY